MIAGSTNAGKTTLLRALANEIPPHERLITVERALELGLDEFPDLHPNVVAFEERLPNSEGQGRISMAELVRRSLRMNPSRVIVGEVLGDEIVTMLNAMSQGNDGSLSTIHANSSSEVFNRIATYALQADRAAADRGLAHADRRRDQLRGLHRAAQRLPARAAACAGTCPASARSTAWTAGCVSSEIWAPGPDGRARPAAPIQCLRRPRGGRLPAGRLRQVGRVISTDLLLALLGGAVAGGGLLLLVASLVGWAPAEPARPVAVRPDLAGQHRPAARPRRRRWPRSPCWSPAGWWSRSGVGLLGFFATALFGGATQGRTEVAQLEALASWTESLRDTIAGAVGLEQAIPASYHAAAPVLKPPLALLIDRLRTREPLPEALLRFGDDLNDPGADLILAALVLNARLRGPGLRDVLTALSQAAREEMDMRGRIEASRASTRRSVQIITGLTLLVVFGLRFLNPSLRRAVRLLRRPGHARRGLRRLRRRLPLAAQPEPVRHAPSASSPAGPAPPPPAGRRCRRDPVHRPGLRAAGRRAGRPRPAAAGAGAAAGPGRHRRRHRPAGRRPAAAAAVGVRRDPVHRGHQRLAGPARLPAGGRARRAAGCGSSRCARTWR